MALKIERNRDLPTLIRFGIAIILGAVGFSLNFIYKPVLRGFSCGDLSIHLPSKESEESISLGLFYLIAVPVTFFVVATGEMLMNVGPDERFGIKFPCRWNSDRRLWQMARFISIWMLGIAIDLLCVNFVKPSVGALRPDFIAQCNPTDITYAKGVEDCRRNNDTTHFFGSYICQRLEENNAKLIDSRRSFYSGHASSAFFCATFLIFYIHCRIWPCFRRLLTDLFVVLYVLLIGAASYVAISRLVDRKHHTVDIVCGALAGKAVALLLVFIHREHFLASPAIRTVSSVSGDDGNGSSKSAPDGN